MIQFLKISTISCLCLLVLVGCTSKEEPPSVQDNNTLSMTGSIESSKPDMPQSNGTRKRLPSSESVATNVIQEQNNVLKQQQLFKEANEKRIKEDIMTPFSKCADMGTSEELKQFLASTKLSDEQKKEIQKNVGASIQKCQIGAAVRENISCNTLGEVTASCEEVKTAAKLIREYESSKEIYKKYFGDPTVIKPSDVFNK